MKDEVAYMSMSQTALCALGVQCVCAKCDLSIRKYEFNTISRSNAGPAASQAELL
jgi:hypothetical protein